MLKAQNRPCWICGGHIDQRLHWHHPGSFTVHHIRPLSRGGAPLDPANTVPAHRDCNLRLGNRMAAYVDAEPVELVTSQQW